MKSLKKRIIMTALMLAAIFLIVPSGAFAASNSVSGKIDGVNVSGTVIIGKDYAMASTSASQQVSMTVNLSYTYGLAGSTKTKTINGSDSGFKTGVSSKRTPAEFNSKSLSAGGSHTCIVNGTRWNKGTQVKY